ncbi:Rho termination factor N-terminal domain-containing protein [Parapedobacter sp. ISTM3]|uniref:Rho termination factor N-terminal domain-containing protein n=1 Tax=Parapedobacter sp. ISTM3 TaxID=2800130 RepID=UPI0019042632|nr:Rho termination factor N-terminal domain-containing protein [Parapedobacter sp. ISTM3]MBK1441580.1 Rho termination factor N-terminal domain-containing protein [Parapedobacter sp. ISTM3]
MAKDHGKQIKDDEKYEALKEKGMSKEKAARIANTPDAGKKGVKAGKLDERTKGELIQEAKKIGITGYSKLNKKDLIDRIRNH